MWKAEAEAVVSAGILKGDVVVVLAQIPFKLKIDPSGQNSCSPTRYRFPNHWYPSQKGNQGHPTLN
jgi:hypothetical protein